VGVWEEVATTRLLGPPPPLSTASIALLCCTGSGLVYGLSIWLEPSGLRGLLGLVALVPFLACVSRCTPGRAALLAVSWTLAATAVVAAWLPATLMRFFGFDPAQAMLGWLGLALLVNLPPYLIFAAWLAWRSAHRPIAPLTVAAAWLLAETARAHGIVPNPYALLGMSLVGTPIAQVAELVGVFGVGALAACTASAAASSFTPALRGTRPLRDLGLAGAALVLAFGFGLWRLDETSNATDPAVRVAVVQPGLAPSREDPQRDARIDLQLRQSREALAQGPDLLVWPEYSVGFFPRDPSPAREHFLQEASALGTDLIFGAPHYRNGSAEPAQYTSVFLLRGGLLRGRYDKRRLVPFAEYDPLARLAGAPLLDGVQYESGRSARPLRARAASVGSFLCGEVLFPGVARSLAAAGATLLANPSNDGWFTSDTPARHQLDAARLRAIENRRGVVRATSDGYSAVIDPQGRVLARSGRGTAEVLVAEVVPSHASTLHQRSPRLPLALALLLVAGSTFVPLRPHLRQGDPPHDEAHPRGPSRSD
jgi:apolipoprotein N-acyltransferase